jgi:hypothetical protein
LASILSFWKWFLSGEQLICSIGATTTQKQEHPHALRDEGFRLLIRLELDEALAQ